MYKLIHFRKKLKKYSHFIKSNKIYYKLNINLISI